jgi:biotin synthase
MITPAIPSLNHDVASPIDPLLLAARDTVQAGLHEEARIATEAEFGDKVFVRGVIEISNYCRQNCHYCGMRREHRDLARYRIPYEQLLELILERRPSYVTDLNLQAGEDPKAAREIALPLLRELKARTNLGLSVGLGTLEPELCDELKKAGASYYILKFETANPVLYKSLEAPHSLSARIEAINYLAGSGWQVSSGFMSGLPGETFADVETAFRLAAELPLVGVSVSPFIPGRDTPLAESAPGNVETALNCLALLRLRHPERIMPAVSAFGMKNGEGYTRTLRAGANLATVNLTPADWQGNYPIYDKSRWIMNEERLLRALEAAGRQPSPISLRDHLAQSCLEA